MQFSQEIIVLQIKFLHSLHFSEKNFDPKKSKSKASSTEKKVKSNETDSLKSLCIVGQNKFCWKPEKYTYFGFKPIANFYSRSSKAIVKILTELLKKQVRTNIGLAATLIPSSVIYLIFMGRTGPCDLIKIIFGYHVNS